MSIPPAFPPAQAERLRKLPCRGTFEAHLTVSADGPERREAFRRLCAELGVKCVLIELARGASRSQPMTASYYRGELPAVMEQVEALHARLWAGSFPVVRVKLEAVATNPGVPATDAEAAALPEGYFEFHAKLRLPGGADLEALRTLCERHGAHLSRNDRKRDEGGAAERFVTLRVYRVGRERANAAYETLLRDLSTADFAVIGQQREFTVYDGHSELDAGWLAAGQEGGAAVSTVLDQLQDKAQRRGEPLGRVVRLHLLEGVLRRVGRLPDVGGFVLRGGLLTRAWVAPWPRPTRDLDFVGDFPFSVEETARRFQPALTAAVEDGVCIDPDRFAAQGIWTDTNFPGARLSLWLGLGEADQPLSVDVGFGDPLIPEPVWLDYPSLLARPAARVRACRPETQAAWKLHGLAEMGTGWRPKDLADLYLIVSRVPLQADALPPAIEAAFVSRGYRAEDAVSLFDRPHWATKTARVRWDAHRGRLGELPQLVAEVRRRLAPALAALGCR